MDAKLKQLYQACKEASKQAQEPLSETKDATAGGGTIDVSETVSKAASAYEKVRNTLDYQEEHLIRRNAIRRILKRRMEESGSALELSRYLLHELIWARYLPNKKIPEAAVPEIASIIQNYKPLFSTISNTRKDYHIYFDWLLDLISSQIEEKLAPGLSEDALVSFAYQYLSQNIEWRGKAIQESERDLQLYIAVNRVLIKADTATLRWRLFNLYCPDWRKNQHQQYAVDVASRIGEVRNTIESQIFHPQGESISRFLRKYGAIFIIMHDIVKNDPEKFAELVENGPSALDSEVAKAAEKRHDGFQKRLRRGVWRAILFLFLTKMILAIVLEIPYDIIFHGSVATFPIFVNIIFHPTLLAVIGLTVFIPKQKNTQKIQKGLRSVIFGEGKLELIYKSSTTWSKTAVGQIFNFLYFIMFAVSYGIIAFLLYGAGFNVFSIILFLFFFSLVTFYGVKIRLSKRDLVIVDSGGGLVGFIFDLFFLPIIRVGRWMSLRAPRVNVFLFFLDFIVEAPFKLAIGVIEGWIAFVKEKKEEI